MRHASKLALALLACPIASWGAPALAASHREAPLIALDPAADNTDVYAFVSYDKANLLRAPDDRHRVHIREEARFTLHLLNDPQTALKLAQENWQVQKESADLRI